MNRTETRYVWQFGAYQWQAYLRVPSIHQVLFYWWKPDSAFAGKGVSEVIFPAYNPDEHGLNIYKTAVGGSKLWKMASSAVAQESFIMQFFDLLSIGMQSIMAMVEALQRQDVAQQAAHREVACQWVRENKRIWKKWVPSSTSCAASEGLVDSKGAFTTDIEQANSCAVCSPGKYSFAQQFTMSLSRTCKTYYLS